jgi:hypothetical protein
MPLPEKIPESFERAVVSVEYDLDKNWSHVGLACGHTSYVLDYWNAPTKYCPSCVHQKLKALLSVRPPDGHPVDIPEES